MPISSLPPGSGLRPGYRLEAKEIIYTNIRGAQATSRKIDPLALAMVKALYEFPCTFNVGIPCKEQVRIELYSSAGTLGLGLKGDPPLEGGVPAKCCDGANVVVCVMSSCEGECPC